MGCGSSQQVDPVVDAPSERAGEISAVKKTSMTNVQFDADGPPRRKRPLDRRLSLAMTTDLDADADDIRGNHEPDEAHESFISASRYGGISATEPSVDDEPSISVAPLITYVLFSNVFTLLFLQYMVGTYTKVGDPNTHANEDRYTVVIDLLEKNKPGNMVRYQGTQSKAISYFGVYDGHGGSACADALKKNLHVIIARHIYSGNLHEAMGLNITAGFEETERKFCKSFSAGACCNAVVQKGRKLYCGNAGDSMSVLVPYDKKAKKPGSPIIMNDRHAVYLSPQEKERLENCGAEVSQEPGMEDALIARNKRGGNIYKAIYPSRSFGDSDFKTRTKPIPALIATPTGRGVDYEGSAITMDGSDPYYLIVACDGLWDFMELPQIIETAFKRPNPDPEAMAELLVKTAQGKKYESDDDVTVIVTKFEFR